MIKIRKQSKLGKLIRLFVDFSNKLKDKNLNAFASYAAFFLCLSLVPMLVMLCTIIPYTPLTESMLVEFATDLTPDAVDDLITRLISEVYDKSAGILSIAAVATLWSAGKGMMALMAGLNFINGETEKRNYFVVRGIACIYTLIILAMVIFSLFAMVFGNQIIQLVLFKFPYFQLVYSFFIRFRFIYVWAIFMVIFAVIYAFVPNNKLKLSEEIPGALLAAIAWNLYSLGFSIYVDYSATAGLYGTFSVLMLAMLWIYFCMYIFLFGYFVNSYLRPVRTLLFKKRLKKKDEES